MSSKIAIFASGSGSNAENIVTYFSNRSDVEFPVIISNKADAFVHQRARKLNIQSLSFSKEQFNEGTEIIKLLKSYNIDFIVLAGFLLKIPSNLIDKFPCKIINIHPALLPKYGGKGMYGDYVHQAVKEAGEKESGITIHFVNENYDEGSIIFQAKCEISDHDSVSEIAAKVHALEYKYFPEVIKKVLMID